MIESRTWGYFHPTVEGFDTRATPLPPRIEPDENDDRDCLVVISQAVAGSITKGRLPFDRALDAGMAFVDARDYSRKAITEALATAYPAGRFSEYVCAEVA